MRPQTAAKALYGEQAHVTSIDNNKAFTRHPKTEDSANKLPALLRQIDASKGNQYTAS